ncbi:hypothetical protein H5410_026104 [Solanum commersonii]|uniref:Uncharacterized protein n=1 Tax=Solanum commersonii TaxID=4109 RepID=A0A9J5YZV6_SOLCO|nr:hypothetical protein H5410_026104 [Solanum commersonii]
MREMFKVTHVKKSKNPTEEEKWIEPRAQETYDRYIRISQEYRSTLPLESQSGPFTQEENENLWKQSLVNRLEVQSTAIQKRRIRRRSLGNILPPCPASSDESDQEGDENDKSDKESEGDEE